MAVEYHEVRLQRQDRPWEMWHCQFEQGPDGQIIRCGVCLKGIVEPRVDAACGCCGALVVYVYQRSSVAP
jgi:hypothetical protein